MVTVSKLKKYSFNKGQVYDLSDVEIPGEWLGEFFPGDPLTDKKYEPHTTFMCIKSCKLNIELIAEL